MFSILFFVCVLIWPAWAFAIDQLGRKGDQLPSPEIIRLSTLQYTDESTESAKSTIDWQPVISGHDSAIEALVDSSHEYGQVRVLAYVYREQHQGKEMINSMNRLVSTKDETWRRTETKSVPLDTSELISVNQSQIQSSEDTILVWTWYQVGAIHTGSTARAKLLETRDRLLLRNTQSIAWFLVADASLADAQTRLRDAASRILPD